ncbi:ATP-binding protein [Streptomyces xinghaiensis]|uniref:ATP-binding protein n=1 Tax=Streptomyces xinghaiensis TaxID=1038928 RepID=UPI0037889B70
MLTVAPDWAYALQLPHDPRAPRIARTTLRAVLDGHGLDDLADTAELLASEMVTNAYRHTGGPSSMRLRGLPDGRLRITVRDTDPTVPPPFDKPPCPGAGTGADVVDVEAENGRGLHLVRLWADNWGSCLLGDGDHPWPGPRGKLLWIELVRRERFTMAA